MQQLPKQKALELLRKAVAEIPDLVVSGKNSPEFQKWNRRTAVAIEKIFAPDVKHMMEFRLVNFTNLTRTEHGGFIRHPWHTAEEAYKKGLEKACTLLESMIEEVEEFWPENRLPPDAPDISSRAVANPNSKRVFVVHGHDGAAQDKVAKFLKELNLTPVILHEHPNQGLTIIEKFESLADADIRFAVILLTPDDKCFSKDSGAALKFRARQNVILELGFFLGKLGRKNVCILKKDNVEVPSDYDGVVYTPFDEQGGWQRKLMQELKAADFDIDANSPDHS